MKALTDEEDFTLPMTPMIDIVFQLLIFFLLATTIRQEELDVMVRIPPGKHGAPTGAAAIRPISISVRKDGTPTFGGQIVTWEQLREKVIEAASQPVKPVVNLRGDKEAAFGGVARVIQLCQEVKLENVNVQFTKE
jgi:biopolymer transport protein ExbD